MLDRLRPLLGEKRPDFYVVLDLPRTAPASEVRRAYRRLALQAHPDKATDPERKQIHTEIFKLIGRAYGAKIFLTLILTRLERKS